MKFEAHLQAIRTTRTLEEIDGLIVQLKLPQVYIKAIGELQEYSNRPLLVTIEDAEKGQ